MAAVQPSPTTHAWLEMAMMYAGEPWYVAWSTRRGAWPPVRWETQPSSAALGLAPDRWGAYSLACTCGARVAAWYLVPLAVTTKETDAVGAAVGTAVGVVGAVADAVGANEADADDADADADDADADADGADADADFLGTAVVALGPFGDVDDADAKNGEGVGATRPAELRADEPGSSALETPELDAAPWFAPAAGPPAKLE